MEKILYLANSQNAAGAFKDSKETVKMIGEAKVETFRVEARARGIPDAEWVTALVIAFVEISFQEERDTWELFVQKAIDWLNKPELVAEAKHFLM